TFRFGAQLAPTVHNGRQWSMTFVLDPAELVSSALTAVLLAVPLAFPLAAAIVTGPRRACSRARRAIGLGVLLARLRAAAAAVAGPFGALGGVGGVVLVLGLLGAIAAAVLVIVLEDGTAVSAAVGIAACALIGLGEPGQMGAGLSFVTSSVLVVLSAVVIEA